MKSESREVGTNLGLWRYIRPQQFLVAAGGGDDRWYLPAGRGGGDRLFLLRFIHNIFLWPPRRGPNGKGGAVLRGGAAGAPDPLKTLPKTNLALRPFHHPRGALSKNHVFIGSQRLKGGSMPRNSGTTSVTLTLITASLIGLLCIVLVRGWMRTAAATSFNSLPAPTLCRSMQGRSWE